MTKRGSWPAGTTPVARCRTPSDPLLGSRLRLSVSFCIISGTRVVPCRGRWADRASGRRRRRRKSLLSAGGLWAGWAGGGDGDVNDLKAYDTCFVRAATLLTHAAHAAGRSGECGECGESGEVETPGRVQSCCAERGEIGTTCSFGIIALHLSSYHGRRQGQIAP